MAPSEVTDDYYAILQIPQDATIEVIKKSYRRLAISIHPDRNPNKPNATASFQILARAYETISDPTQRRIYDAKWIGIRQRKTTEAESEKRQANENAKRQKEQAASLQELHNLEGQRPIYDSKVFELSRVVRNLSASLKRLQWEDAEQLRKERERNGWWAYLTSPIYGKQGGETEEEKQQRESERLQRLYSKSIKEKELMQQEILLNNAKDKLDAINTQIFNIKQEQDAAKRAEEARRQERVRNEQAAQRRAEAQRQETLRKAAEARRQAQAQAERERQAREDEERIRRYKEEVAKQAREAREAEERARAAREARDREIREAWLAAERQLQEQTARMTREARHTSSRSSTYRRGGGKMSSAGCGHGAFWPQIQGQHRCSECGIVQRRFAFQCPGCDVVACAGCRRIMKGRRRATAAGMYATGDGLGVGVGLEDGGDDHDWGAQRPTYFDWD